MNRTTFSLLAVAWVAVLVLGGERLSGQAAVLPATLKESIASYGSLTSYSDTGTVRWESPGIVDQEEFTTYFRRPTRDFYFDYQALTSTNPGTKFTIDMRDYRSVIWMLNGNMQRYDRKSRTQGAVSSGQAGALQTAAHRTRGTSLLIPSLLYTQAGLSGTITQIEGGQLAGTETINGRACQKITGTAVMILSGRRNNERAVTVWIDAESRLIRRVFEDAKGLPGNTYSRLTVTLDPRANPTIEDARFQFKVPSP
jgi:outer membrane lipoprotein-sorting protein